MDWTVSLQNAINYVEDHLTEEIDYKEVAKMANSSLFNFQRIFNILCGFSLGEYIRNRRLSISGNQLCSSHSKVIDVALKYGYDSPESFCRAFVRFHGITPSQARLNGENLKSFSPLSVKLILDGGCVMDYRIEKTDEIRVISKKEWFTTDMGLNKKEIPKFWTKCNQDGSSDRILKHMNKNSVFKDAILGICFENQMKDDKFAYCIGCVSDDKDVEEDLSIQTLEPSTWVVFNCIGAMPEALQNLLEKIYKEFFPSSEYKPSGKYEIEVYPEGNISSKDYNCEMWISVEKK